MLSLEEARAAILTKITQATVVESVALAEAPGRYLAEPVIAQVDNPAFDNSAMDGYAVHTEDLQNATGWLPVAGESSCGDAPATLNSGTAMRIFTGAPLPDGADSIVIQEDVQRDAGRIKIPRTVTPGQHVRHQGEDFRAGDVLYKPGHLPSAFDVALIASAGLSEVSAFRRPRALVIATGDELVSPGTSLAPGQIYESNRLATLILLRQHGVTAVDGGTVGDTPEALRELLRDSADYDFVVTSGGVSVGDHDLVKQVFAEIGEVDFWKARIKPGKPVAFGRIGARTHFFALPGNPVSSLVTFKLFVEPALVHWHHAEFQTLEINATASSEFHRRAGRMEFVRARLFTQDNRLYAEPLKGQGSHMLGTLRNTNGFIRIAADSEGFAAGDIVSALPLTLTIGDA